MKPILHRFVLSCLLICLGSSCTTAYDAYGRPRQVVEPGAALIGAAAVGLLAYGIANNNRSRRNNDCNAYARHPGYGYHPGYGRPCY